MSIVHFYHYLFQHQPNDSDDDIPRSASQS